jgi:LacI family transcriptional regulator
MRRRATPGLFLPKSGAVHYTRAVKPATQATIARAAGVSQMTVSLALRNHPSISAATRERVRAVAARLGYRRNPLVAALMKQVRGRQPVTYTTTLAFVTNFPTRDGWRHRALNRRYYQGVVERARELGYRVEVFWLGERGMTGRRLSEILRSRGIYGVIIAPLPRPRGHLRLEWRWFAAATIGFSLWRPALHRAAHHQMQSVALAARELHRRGYRRIGLALPADVDARANNNWLAGFLVQRRRHEARENWPFLITRDWSARQFREWVTAYRPDVVLSSELDALRWLRAMGRRVPRDIGFAHLAWHDEARACAGIRQHSRRVGAAAVDLVVEQLEHNQRGLPEHPKIVLIEGEWVAATGTIRRRRGIRC